MALLKDFFKTCGIYSLVTFCIIPGILTDGQCIKKTPCRCEFENGTGVDLSSTVQSSFYQADFLERHDNSFKIFTYFFNPCGDAKFKINDNTTAKNPCEGEPLSICRKEFHMTMVNSTFGNVTENKYERIGLSEALNFTNDGSALIYRDSPSETTIFLACTTSTANELVVQRISKEQPQNFFLTFHTRESCLKTFTVEHHTSLGSVLIIILFVMILTYLLLGMGTLYFSGARGIEIIPNLSFWVDLPVLVRDGVSYLRNGCKLTPTSAMPDHYDSI